MARTPRKEGDRALLLALACGATVESAARKAGVSQRTAYRRLTDPAFRERLKREGQELVLRTARMLTGAGPTSVKTLVDLQNGTGVPAAVRRGAARDVLEMSVRLREVAENEYRIAELEERVRELREYYMSRPAGHGT